MATGLIATLIDTGGDAFTNLWDVNIMWPLNVAGSVAGGADSTQKTSARALGFTPPPNLTAITYAVKYKAVTVTRPGAEATGDRRFTIRFRNDNYYDLYDNFIKWKHLLVDPSGQSNAAINKFYTGLKVEDTTRLGQIVVKASDSNTYQDSDNWDKAIGADNIKNLIEWTFYDVAVLDVKLDPFSRDNSAAQLFEVDFMFARFREPGNSISDASTIPSTDAPAS